MTTAADTDIDAFLGAAWEEHSDRAEAVAERVAASFHLVQAPSDAVPYARLLTHVYGEHLGRWQAGAALLDAMRALPAVAAAAEAPRLLGAYAAALRFAGGDAEATAPLAPPERALALAAAATALTGRGAVGAAIAAFASALAIGETGLPDGALAVRAIAVAGNNLAMALEEQPSRSAAETEAMVAAARAGLAWWRRAGTWLEEERAEHRLSRSLLAAGAPEDATAHAMRCVAICDANDALPIERFFAQAALALAHRAAGRPALGDVHRALAIDLAARVEPGSRVWCQDDLDALGT